MSFLLPLSWTLKKAGACINLESWLIFGTNTEANIRLWRDSAVFKCPWARDCCLILRVIYMSGIFHFPFSVSFTRAYIHQYTKFGIEEEDFLDSFTLLEQVVASYCNLWPWTDGSRGKVPYVTFRLKYFQYCFPCKFSNFDLLKATRSDTDFFCILCPQNRTKTFYMENSMFSMKHLVGIFIFRKKNRCFCKELWKYFAEMLELWNYAKKGIFCFVPI